MEALGVRAEKSGNYGATFQCEQAVGKLEGHYVEKNESVNKTRDQLHSLAEIADSLGKDRSLEMARDIGMEDQLREYMETVQ